MISRETKDVVKRFCEECRQVRTLFDEFQILFEHSQKRLRLLEEVAHHFFLDLNDILHRYLLLNMCKLTDRPHSRGDDNLSVAYILELVGQEKRLELGLDEHYEKIRAIEEYVKPARHKVIAHIDKDASLADKTWGEIPKEIGDSFWEGLQEFVNEVHRLYFDGEVFPLDTPSNAEILVDALKRAVHFKDYFTEHRDLLASAVPKMRYRDA